FRPAGPQRRHAAAQGGAAVQLGPMALAIVEAQGLHVAVLGQRPGQAGGGILAARKQDQRPAPGLPGGDHASASAASRRFMVRTMALRATPYMGTNSKRLTASLMT